MTASKPPRMTPAVLHVLLSLADGPSHGYAIMGDVAERTDGRVELGPSSLYYTLGRLDDADLIREAAPEPESDEPHEEQRRYFELTEEGRRHLAAEVDVLHGILDHARAAGLGRDRG